MKKAIYGFPGAVPECITDVHLADMSKILDIAAGTCVWTLELAQMPQIKPRLHPDSPSLSLYACDINKDFFPDPSITEAFGVVTFQQDVTKDFPNDLYGQFDLVHISFLAICLTISGWETALNNCARLLSLCSPL